jgi:hypothetical protein
MHSVRGRVLGGCRPCIIHAHDQIGDMLMRFIQKCMRGGGGAEDWNQVMDTSNDGNDSQLRNNSWTLSGTEGGSEIDRVKRYELNDNRALAGAHAYTTWENQIQFVKIQIPPYRNRKSANPYQKNSNLVWWSPLWSNGQCSWLHIQRSGFDSLRYQIFFRSSGSGTGPTEPREYNWGATWKKSSFSGLENREYGCRDPARWPRGTLYPQKLALSLSKSGGRSVGIVLSRTQAMEFI